MSKLKNENLEQDLLIEYSSRLLHFYNTHKTAVLSAAFGLLVVIGLVVGYFFYMTNQQEEAQRLLSIAESELLQNNYVEALNGSEEDLTLGFIQIADNYSGTDAGNLAHYYAAVSEFELGNFEQAESYIREYDLPEGILGVPPIALHANILMELEQFEAAAEKYEQAAEWNQNDSTTPLNLFKAAEAYIEAGNSERALELLTRIVDEYEDSRQHATAIKLRNMLDGTTTGA
jgi:tetratricopeptide (TPR) repeat protein